MRVFLVAALCVAITACASKSSTNLTPSDQWRLASLEEGYLELKEKARRLEEDLRVQDERLTERMDSLDKRVGEVVVTVESVQNAKQRDLVEVNVDPGNATMGGAESGEPKPWATVPGMDMPADQPQDKPSLPAQSQAQQSAVQQNSSPLATKKDAEPSLSGHELYDYALALYRKDEPGQARILFTRFLDSNQGDPLCANAQYWIGETYYDQKQFPQAILAFREVSAKYPDHPKAAAALLKTALSYEKLSDVGNTRFYLQALVDRYPDSGPAKLARQKLSAMQ